MVERLGNGSHYSDSYLSDNIIAENMSNMHVESTVSIWDSSDQCQLYHEAMKCLGHRGGIHELRFKSEQMNVQRGVKTCG